MKIRKITISDTDECGRVTHEAFSAWALHHSFPSDFPSVEYAISSVKYQVDHPNIVGFVAEVDKKIVGLIFLNERDPIHALAGFAVSPNFSNRGVGKSLLKTVLKRETHSLGTRLVTDAFNARSFSLYTSFGFVARETCMLMSGQIKRKHLKGYTIRPLIQSDLRECSELCTKVHGFNRSKELLDAIECLNPLVAVKDKHVCAYATTLQRWHRAHGIAETYQDMAALIIGAATIFPDSLSLLVPIEETSLLRFCLNGGMKAVKPMIVMSIGMYQKPIGSYFPSVLY